MKLNKTHKLIILILTTAILAAIYWGFGNTAFTMPITVVYFVLCLILTVAYILVNRGIKPMVGVLRKGDEKRKTISQLLLLIVIPLYLIFMIDIILLQFIS